MVSVTVATAENYVLVCTNVAGSLWLHGVGNYIMYDWGARGGGAHDGLLLNGCYVTRTRHRTNINL